jgi:predicted double-glycine peptidase
VSSTWLGFFDALEQPEKASEIEHLIRIPMVRQPDTYSCGTAAVLSVLAYYGMEIGYEDITKAIKATKEDGADHRNIIKFLKEKGLEVELYKGMLLSDLQSFIDEGTPVIVVIQAWAKDGRNYENEWDSGHYAVVVGYDDANVYLMDPSTLGNYAYIPIDEFSKRWHDQDQDIKLRQAGIVIKAEKRYDIDEIKKLK